MEESAIDTSPPEDLDQSAPETAQPQAPAGTDLKGWFDWFKTTAKDILFTPQVFFQTMAQDGGLREPLVFYCLVAGFSAIVTALLKLDPLLCLYSFASELTALFLGTGISHTIFRLTGGKGSFEATFRVLAYSKVTLLVGWLPAIQIVGWLYAQVLCFIGWRKVHQRSELETAVVVGASTLVMALNWVGWKFLHF